MEHMSYLLKHCHPFEEVSDKKVNKKFTYPRLERLTTDLMFVWVHCGHGMVPFLVRTLMLDVLEFLNHGVLDQLEVQLGLLS